MAVVFCPVDSRNSGASVWYEFINTDLKTFVHNIIECERHKRIGIFCLIGDSGTVTIVSRAQNREPKKEYNQIGWV